MDSDHDGIPDAWELLKGLDANNSKDALYFTLSKGYSNLEVYINSIVSDPQH